jgi:macrolide-specific efflux system membrane fusion protein
MRRIGAGGSFLTMTIRRPVVINSVLAVVIVGGLVGAYFFLFPSTGSTSSATQLTSTVQQGVVSNTITANGSVAPITEQTASFGVSGTIASVNVALGQTVTAGQALGTLQTAPLQQVVNNDATLLSQARTLYANASSALAATEAAPTSPNGSAAQTVSSINSAKQQVTSALDQVTTDSQTLAKDEANLADATLTSPITGLVVALNGSVGQASGSGSAASGSAASGASAATSSTSSSGFAVIADVSAMTVTASIAEADIASVTVGQKAVVTFPAVPGQTANATVTAIAPTATTSNSVVTYPTTIRLDSIPAGLRLGQTAAVAITTKSSSADALYIPSAAITTVNGVSTVKVVGGSGKVTPVTVTLGIVGNVGTQIVTGLKVGQTVSLGVVAASTGSSGTGRAGFGGGAGGFGTRTGGGGGGFGGGPGGGTSTRGGN